MGASWTQSGHGAPGVPGLVATFLLSPPPPSCGSSVSASPLPSLQAPLWSDVGPHLYHPLPTRGWGFRTSLTPKRVSFWERWGPPWAERCGWALGSAGSLSWEPPTHILTPPRHGATGVGGFCQRLFPLSEGLWGKKQEKARLFLVSRAGGSTHKNALGAKSQILKSTLVRDHLFPPRKMTRGILWGSGSLCVPLRP